MGNPGLKAGEVWRDVEPILAGLGVGAVLAQEQEAEDEAAADEEEIEDAAADDGTEAGEAEDAEALPELAVSDVPSFSQVEVDLLQDLRARRDTLDTRDRAQDLRERLLEAAEARIDQKIAELKAIEETIRALLVQHDEEKEEAMRRLVKMYENMKPKDAARIFTELDMEILLDVAERMREVKMAPILAAMAADPRRASHGQTRLTAQAPRFRQLSEPSRAPPVARR